VLSHDFRPTAVRNPVRAAVSEQIAMEITGHKPRFVFDRYNIVSSCDLFEAARKLDSFSAGIVSGIVCTKDVQSVAGEASK
jgi:hypothetical protein